MSDLAVAGRTTWDLVLGGLLVVVGIVVLARGFGDQPAPAA